MVWFYEQRIFCLTLRFCSSNILYVVITSVVVLKAFLSWSNEIQYIVIDDEELKLARAFASDRKSELPVKTILTS